MNENNICRLCLQENKGLLNVFCSTLREGNAHEKILKYLYLDIKQDDLVTKSVCLNCLRKIEEFHSFCEQVEQNQERFRYIKPPEQELLFETTERLAAPQIANISISCGEILLNNDSGIIVQIKSEQRPDHVQNIQYTTERTLSEGELTFPECPEEELEEAPKVQVKPEYSYQQQIDWQDNDSNSSSDAESNLSDEVSNDRSLQAQDIEDEVSFPDVIIKDEKFVVHGKQLISLITRFYKLSCDLCLEGSDDQNHSTLASLFNHYKQYHMMKGYVLCCGLKLSKLRRLALHMARHLQPEAFKCPECGKIMTSPKILRYHIQNHLPEDKRPLGCPQCPRRFSYSSALVAHQICHLPEDQRDSHICDECGKTFMTSGRLAKHINSAHINNTQLFICHTCGKQFNCKGNFNYHLATHEKFHQVQCETCGKWLKNKLCLRKHMNQHSTIRHNCTICSYSTTNRQCLQNHLRVRHSNEKPYTCEECGRDFKLKNTLINHMVQHTGERRYTCEFCNKQFASSGNYYAHRKRMHPVELAERNQRKEEEMRIYREIALERRMMMQNGCGM